MAIAGHGLLSDVGGAPPYSVVFVVSIDELLRGTVLSDDFFMRCVHYAMFAAVPFVNCTNHVVKTFIRRNPKSYPITMHTVVVTPSAMYCLM